MFIDFVRFLVTFNIKWTNSTDFYQHTFFYFDVLYNGDSFNRFTSGVKSFLSKCNISMRDGFLPD